MTQCTNPITPTCRFCGVHLKQSVVDLGMSPLANSYLRADQLHRMEPFYPLRVFVCSECLLVQAEDFESPESIFGDYAYFASYSDTWLKHAQSYAEMAIKRFALNNTSRVIELASNDGYLLQYFVERSIPVLGLEPAANVAEHALKNNIPTIVKFFGTATASELVSQGIQADLLVGNNVLAHVPKLNDFVEGMKIVLKPLGVITMEFPHLVRLVQDNQFDTIYHEHFSYFSLLAVEKILSAHGLALFDVEELSTHGGSIRIYACHVDDASKPMSQRVIELRASEQEIGLSTLAYYQCFSEKVKITKYKLLDFLIRAKSGGKTIVGYGAPAKGNTLLNYCGIRSDFLDYTVDRSPHKQEHFLPGTHIPIYHPDKIKETKPDYVLILPWNLKNEVMAQMAFIRDWGGQFVVPIPEVEILL